MLMGAHAGGNGFQWYGYSIIDENYFASKALLSFDAGMAKSIQNSVTKWLSKPAVASWKQDRRENMWGSRGALSYMGTCSSSGSACKVEGSYTPDPPLAGSNQKNAAFVVYSELNGNTSFTVQACSSKVTGNDVNHCSTLALA